MGQNLNIQFSLYQFQTCKWDISKEINIKNRIYYFFDDMIKIQDLNANLLKKDKKSYKHINITLDMSQRKIPNM